MLKGQRQSHIRIFFLIFKITPAGPPVGQANIMSILFKKTIIRTWWEFWHNYFEGHNTRMPNIS